MFPIGPRLWKTGLAVALAGWLAQLTGLFQIYAALAAALGVAPTASRSWRSVGRQIGINLFAGLVGGVTALLFGSSPLVTGVTVVLALVLCVRAGLAQARDGVLSATLFTMAPHPGSIEGYILERWLSIALGCVVGVTVNALIVPPDYRPKTVAALKQAGAALDAFVLHVLERLGEPHAYPKREILTAAGRVEVQIAEARRLQQLAADAEGKNGPGQNHVAVLGRAVKVLASQLERCLVMHKAALTACRSPGYPRRLPEVQAALRELVVLRQAVYGGLECLAPPPGLQGKLEAMAERFFAAPAEPEGPADVLPYFQRYHLRTSLAEMASRLARLCVAMENVEPTGEVTTVG